MDLQGSFAVAAFKLRRMLALSSVWQQGVGAALEQPPSYTDALAAIMLKNAAGETLRPYAVISPGMHHNYELVAGGDRNYLRPNGGLWLYLTQDTNPDYYDDTVAAEFDAASFFGQIIDDLAELSGQDDPGAPDQTSHLSIIRLSMVTFSETDEEVWQSLGRFYFAGYNVDWGDTL